MNMIAIYFFLDNSGSIFEHVYNTSRNIYENLTKIPKSNISGISEYDCNMGK